MENYPLRRELPHCLLPDRNPADWNEPLDSRDLATRLETEGVTDAVARARFGHPDTWAMAEAWLPRVLDYRKSTEAEPPPPKAWGEYWKGISFALPLLISSASILLFGFALWGGDLSNEEATAIGLGTIASFLLTGGFVQVMARRGLFFTGTRQFRRCEYSTWWWFRAGGGAMLIAIVFLLATSQYWGWLPARLNLVAAGFCLALGLFWMAAGVLHYLNRSLEIAGVTLGGILLVGCLHTGGGVSLLVAQLSAISAATVAAGGLAFLRLRRMRENSTAAIPRPRLRDAIFLWPYFLYGVFYYLLLFSDRLVAWTAHTQASSLVIQFRGDYENALNLGLLAFIFQVGWVQHSIALFYRELATGEKRLGITHAPLLGRVMTRFYWNRVARFVPFAVMVSLLPAALEAGVVKQVARETAAWSMIGFPFLIVGLWNASLLFGLSGASKAAAAAGIATLLDVFSGYILSRLGTHHQAVIGFAIGAAAFAAISGYWSLHALRRVDHRYYVASQ